MKSPFYLMTILFLLGFLSLPFAVTTSMAQEPDRLEAAPDILDSPSTLPDLTPDVIDRSTPPVEDPPIFNDDKSTIAPGMEPWQREKRRMVNGQTADDIFWTLPQKIQDQILAESYEVHAQCVKYSMYSKFHDCECLGSLFFEERVFTPEATKEQINHEISSECTATASIAGYAYEECMTRSVRLLNTDKVDEFCTCYGNTYADTYKTSPYPDYSNLRSIGIRSNRACFKKVPGALRDLDPDNPYR